jgi:putative MATE family efflux protein
MNRDTLRLIRDALAGKEQDYTGLPLRRAVVLLAIPMVMEMLMESLFAVTDIFFVARLGTRAVATVGLTESVLMLFYSLAMGLSMAATAMVARRVGEGDRQQAAVAAAQTIWLGLILSVILGLAGYFSAPQVLRLMGGDAELVREGQAYTRIMFGGNITIMLLFMLNAVFRGAGDASLAMRTLWLGNGINILLDPCLIFGLGPFPEMGIEGAAVASVIGRGAGVAYQLYHLLRGSHVIRLARRHLVWSGRMVRRLLSIGVNGAAQYLIATASWIFLMRIIADFGPDPLAGYTIAIRVVVFTILPAWGMANAASTLVGQHLGAGQPGQAEASAWLASRYSMLFMLAVAAGYIAFADPIIALFTSEQAVIAHGGLCLRVISLGYIFYAYGMVISQAFNGAGDTRTPMYINLVGFWLIEIPLAWWLAKPAGMGPLGVYIAIAISESLVAVGCILLFRQGSWKKTRV